MHRLSLLWLTGDVAAARTVAPAAVTGADRVGRTDLGVLARSYQGYLQAADGDVDAGLASLREAIDRGLAGDAR